MDLKGIPKRIKDYVADKVDDINMILDTESISRYYSMIMKDEKVTYEGAVYLCETVPKYSLGLKMCSPAMIIALQKEENKEKFKKELNEEELRLFEDEVQSMNFKKMWKEKRKENKKNKKNKKKGLEEVENPEYEP